jgi:hypothetical protein
MICGACHRNVDEELKTIYFGPHLLLVCGKCADAYLVMKEKEAIAKYTPVSEPHEWFDQLCMFKLTHKDVCAKCVIKDRLCGVSKECPMVCGEWDWK